MSPELETGTSIYSRTNSKTFISSLFNLSTVKQSCDSSCYYHYVSKH